MKRLLICIYALLAVTIVMADNVTPEEALQQATQFVKERIATGQHARRSPGSATPQLTLAKKVSGLYVFNVDNHDGFVIVSNDDRTEAILGYSDKGSFDPNNIPDNMRTWLQGYADEIAWLNEHPRPAAIKAPRRTSDATIKTPIAPLVQTTWDQGEPYNNLCPYYHEDDYGNISYSVNYVNGYEHCATGCVATAMAQVMKYHEWPEQATQNIPSYSWEGNDMTELAPVAFDWNNMILDYSGNYTNTQATAIATLMKHCGYSVEMDYGESSGAATSKTADALKTYFNYKETTVSKNRSYYTYANWIELLYHELEEGRVVLYHGASTGGGHAFVCDGYQGEDYFHINWGWGGMSDNYFKLSALDSDAQGIGGSSSEDGFNYLQGAVVGIQKPEGTGTVLDLDETPSLSLKSISISSNSIRSGESVDVTFRVRNTSSMVYDGDIYVYVSQRGLKNGKNFVINPGETKDCVISYTPSGFTGTVYIYAAFPGEKGGNYYIDDSKYAYLTVSSSTASNNVELTMTVGDVENTELLSYYSSGKPAYSLYGNHFKGSVTFTNSTNTDYNGELIWQLVEESSLSGFSIKEVPLYVSKNSSTDIVLEVDNLDMSVNNYYLCLAYVYNNSASIAWYSTYSPAPAIMAYAADGTNTVVIPSGNSYDALTNAPNALAVNVTGTNITSITPNTQPNAVYIYSGTKPSGLDGKNVIEYNNGNYSAESITLTDGNGFYSPVDFTADNVEFNYNFTVAADGTNGWNTLMLPFNVTKVTATDPTTNETKEIDWFHSADNKGKNFWVKEFCSDANNTVNFDFADKMKANTPYIVAFPGNKWGNKWDMSNKVLKFIGESVTVSKGGTVSSVTGSSYRFIGNTVQDDTENIYTMNADGNKFVQNENSGSAPFRAYFKPGIYDRTVTSLAIGSEPGGTTGIEDVNLNDNGNDNVDGKFFNLNGQRVMHPTKGLYINNGKKIIIK